jgi:hypothetical protein
LIPKANKIITIASQILKPGASKVPEDPECMITLPTSVVFSVVIVAGTEESAYPFALTITLYVPV